MTSNNKLVHVEYRVFSLFTKYSLIQIRLWSHSYKFFPQLQNFFSSKIKSFSYSWNIRCSWFFIIKDSIAIDISGISLRAILVSHRKDDIAIWSKFAAYACVVHNNSRVAWWQYYRMQLGKPWREWCCQWSVLNCVSRNIPAVCKHPSETIYHLICFFEMVDIIIQIIWHIVFFD